METNKIGFNSKTEEKISLDDFKDRWVFLSMRDNTNLSGMMVYLDSEKVGLIPYQKIDYSQMPNPYKIKEKGLPAIIARDTITKFRESNRKEVEGSCDYLNRRSYLEHLKELKETYEHEQIIDQIKKHNAKIILP